MHSCAWTQGQEKYVQWKTEMTSLVRQRSSKIWMSHNKPQFAQHVSFLPEAWVEPEESIHSTHNKAALKFPLMLYVCFFGGSGGCKRTMCKFKNPKQRLNGYFKIICNFHPQPHATLDRNCNFKFFSKTLFHCLQFWSSLTASQPNI